MALAKSVLPAAQQARRQQIIDQQAPGAPAPSDPPAAAAPPVAAPASAPAPAQDPPAPETVSLLRNEFDELQGARDRSDALRLQAETAALENAELKRRLTELTQAGNEPPKPKAAVDLGFDEQGLGITDEERETFGESESFVVKIVRRELAAALNKFNTTLDSRLSGVENAATSAVSTVHKSAQKRFVDRVREAVSDVDSLIKHANFQDFLASRVPRTTLTYNQALTQAHDDEQLEDVKDIFQDFRDKYKIVKADKSGYNGAAPAATQEAPAPTANTTRFSMADRKKKSEDYQKGRISYADLEAYKVEFNKAQEDGRVDP